MKKRLCPECGKWVEVDGEFCPFCGAKLPKMDEDEPIIGEETGTETFDHGRVTAEEPTIDEVAFPDMDYDKLWYWSSTPSGAEAWHVNFDVGVVIDTGYRDEVQYSVRLVRGGQ